MVSAVHLEIKSGYPDAPFNPSGEYMELCQLAYSVETSEEPNPVYAGVRELLHLLDLDPENYGTPYWNPLGGLILPGQNVVIKPNLVLHETGNLAGTNSLVTHASVIRPLVDYCLIALQGTGLLKIADVPLQETNFVKTTTDNGLGRLIEYYKTKSIDIPLLDLRKEVAHSDSRGFIDKKTKQTGDPMGYSIVDLGERSMLLDLVQRGLTKFSVSNYDYREAQRHHDSMKNEYYICNTFLAADVIVNVPKLKTHCKSGVTISLKNMIGTSGDKSWLPHYRIGPPSRGGDEFKANLVASIHTRVSTHLQGKSKLLWSLLWSIWQKVKRAMKLVRSKEVYKTVGGAWEGNDTLWRTIVDLNCIGFFADKNGRLQEERQRRFLTIVDGIIAGEGSGPLKPMPKRANLLIGGIDPVEVDLVACRLMNIDWKKIPQIVGSIRKKNLRFTSLEFVDYDFSRGLKGNARLLETILTDGKVEDFVEPFGWDVKLLQSEEEFDTGRPGGNNVGLRTLARIEKKW
jgi:uncharacterized protein (DUF362 family)